MESTVPLDAHGNPITDADDTTFVPNQNEGYSQAEETIGLTSTRGADDINFEVQWMLLGFQGVEETD